MEHLRTDKHQWCDSQLYTIIDTRTLEPVRVFPEVSATGTLEEALEMIKYLQPCRVAIVKLDAIMPFPL